MSTIVRKSVRCTLARCTLAVFVVMVITHAIGPENGIQAVSFARKGSHDLLSDVKYFGRDTIYTGRYSTCASGYTAYHCNSCKADHLGAYRGALWVHNGAAKSVENGNWKGPWHRTSDVACSRVASYKFYKQPMAVVFKGKIMGFDNPRGTANPGIKIHVGHVSNNNNYVVHVNTQKTCGGVVNANLSCVRISREINHKYKTLAQRNYGFKSNGSAIYTWKIVWSGNRIKVYHRLSSDPWNNSNDKLILTGPVDTTYTQGAVGLYLDGAVVRFYDFHTWQG